MTARKGLISRLVFTSAGALLLTSMADLPSAKAGFEWVPGAQKAAPEKPAPIAPVTPMPLEDLAPIATPPAQASPVIEQESVLPPLPAPAVEPLPANLPEAIVEGFGTDIPLAIALQQLAPAGFAFSYDPAVNPGVRVSWSDGKTWTQTVQDMLAPHNLNARFSDRVVHIRPASIDQHGALMQDGKDDLALEEDKTPEETAAADAPPQQAQLIKRMSITDPGDIKNEQTAQLLAPPQNEAKTEMVVADAASSMEPTMNEIVDNAAPATSEPPPLMPMPMALESPAVQTDEIIELLPPPVTEEAKAPISLLEAIEPAAGDPQQSASQEAAPTHQMNADKALESPVYFWQAKAGDSLRETLESWTEQANIELVWKAAHDFRVDEDIMMSDNFQNALKTMVNEGLSPDNRPAMRFSNEQGTDGKKSQAVLIIQDSSQNTNG